MYGSELFQLFVSIEIDVITSVRISSLLFLIDAPSSSRREFAAPSEYTDTCHAQGSG
jgi:hypothetical protein